MSASERLRALVAYNEDEDRVCMACLTNYSMLDRLTPALPLIADVVEAAEELAAWWPNEVAGEISGEQFQPTRDALTALREHLEGQ